MFCAIWYHLYNFENVKNANGGVLLLVKLHAEACISTKTSTPPWTFLTSCMIVAFDRITGAFNRFRTTRAF